MLARAISSLLLWGITISSLYYYDKYALLALMAILGAGAIFETTKILNKLNLKPNLILAEIFSIAIFLSLVNEKATLFVLIAVALIGARHLISKYCFGSKYWNYSFLPMILMLVCISVALFFIPLTAFEFGGKAQYTGVLLGVWIIATAKFSDVGGFLFGKFLGKNKLAPKISPNKTWEGAFGGIFLSGLIGAGIYYGFADYMPESFSVLKAVLGGALIACTAIVSDLLESVLKRKANIKDSGNIIPGIGGILDLADSMLLSAPIGYLYLKLVL